MCVCVCVCRSGFSNDSFGVFFLHETKIASAQQKLRPIDYTSAVKAVGNTSARRRNTKRRSIPHKRCFETRRKVKTEVSRGDEETVKCDGRNTIQHVI